MKIKSIAFFLILSFVSLPFLYAQKTWVDSVDLYARAKFMPPAKYKWTWQRASLLRAMTAQYEWADANQKQVYLVYIKACIDGVLKKANGKYPNKVASGLGVAFLARVTGEEKYKVVADKIYLDYLKVRRTKNGGISHLPWTDELWDDTVFMVGVFLQEMYRFTGDEKYLDELLLQVEAHREKLLVKEWGLWVHGYDDDEKNRCNVCGKSGWAKNEQRRSQEIWGRGNGWVVVTLTQTLEILPDTHPKRNTFAKYLSEMLIHLPDLQDHVTGHWFQLPIYPYEDGNYIESSCTAMFAYGINGALKMGVIEGENYELAVKRAYVGLRKHSINQKCDIYLTTKNVCKGTCVGDKQYYYNRKAKSEKSSGIGMFILFGRQFITTL